MRIVNGNFALLTQSRRPSSTVPGPKNRIPQRETYAELAKFVADSVGRELCAWRMGKGVYRFDPDLLQELWETPVTGEIPGEILLRLPEWCVYLELSGRALGKDMHVQGCFAFVDWEPRFGGREELCLIADTPEHGLLPAAPIVLGGSIEDGMRAAMGDYMGLAATIGGPQISIEQVEKLVPATARAAEPIVSLCLYLCVCSCCCRHSEIWT
jgi:hypothetical protein